jgi:hypothetical protein
MQKFVHSVGHGLFAAGFVLIITYFFGVSLKGSEALREALNPFAIRTYVALLPLVPGALLVWVAR